MADLKNEFAWSWSRHRAFQTCDRFYYLQHYGFWGGWENGAANREIYIQKKLSTRPMWIGITVHEAAEWLIGQIRQGHYPAPDRVVERTLRTARRAIEESERGIYRIRPKRSPGFVDHYYGLGTPRDAWAEDLAEIERQIRGLFENRVFQRLASVPERIVEVERLEQVRIAGVPVWVSLDVLVTDGSGGFVIIDWKTGKAHDADTVVRQLGVYGAYVLDRYLNAPPSRASEVLFGRIKGMYVNLRTGEHHVSDLDGPAVGTMVETVRASAAAMRERLQDTYRNIAIEDDFPKLPEGSEACARCVHRRACGRD